jgi:FkbM family methyltransferase
MKEYPTNQQRTSEYFEKFNREKTIKFLIKNNDPLILDVGANSGTSLVEFKGWWPASTIHCFEPQQECWFDLDEQMKRHTTSVVINRCAAGNAKENEAIFYTHKINSGVSGFNKINLQSKDSIYLSELEAKSPNAVAQYGQTLNHERVVRVIRLDDYLVEKKIEHVDLLKIDTQGFEPQVLEGLGDRLKDVDVVITELMFYDYYERSLTFSDIERFLIPAGFHLYDISHIAKNPMNGRTDWVDVIYINNRLRSRG